MKKLKLRLSQVECAEMLTREQLKNVLGGSADVAATFACIKDGDICSTTVQCCNVCLPTNYCGTF